MPDEHEHTHHHTDHTHAPNVTENNERVVLVGFLLTAGFMFAELIGGLLSGSLALVADAGHMLTDAAALALAWAGFRFGRRKQDDRRTFGYMRFEILAGFVNAVTLILLVLWIAYEAVQRLLDPAPVLAGPMFVIAVLGLIVNCGVFWMLRQGDREHVNIKGAMVHVMGDLLGSVAAIVAATAIYFTGWTPIDPILSVVLSAIVLRAAWSLLKASLNVLMEGTPSHIVLAELKATLLEKTPGLVSLDHVHVWSITSGQPLATMDVRLGAGADPATVVGKIKAVLDRDFGIAHATIEVDFGQSGGACVLDAGQAAPAAPDPEAGIDPGHAHHHGPATRNVA